MNGIKSFQAKAAGADGSFSAIVATLGVPDRDLDTIAPGAFSGRKVPIFGSHQHQTVPLGHCRIEERGIEAVAEGKFNLETSLGRDWFVAVKFDLNPRYGPPVMEWSFAFDVIDSERLAGGGRRIRKLSEIEVSPVLRGAGIGTRTTCAGETCKSSGRMPGKSCSCGCSTSRVSVAGVVARAEAALAKADAATRYRYKSLGGDLSLSDLAVRVCDAWGIEPPVVELIAEAGPDETADVRFRSPIAGLHAPGEIFVLDGRGLPDTLRTLGHELCHTWQRAHGLPLSEPEAYQFGDRFAQWAVYSPADPVPRVA